jgi:hypothetical protein
MRGRQKNTVLPPDTLSLDGSPPPSPSSDTTRFDFETYEWLERRQYRDARTTTIRYFMMGRRAEPEQAEGLTPTVFHDWGVVDE